jgi:hypothetical protein
MAWRENGGRIRRVELPGMHDSLTGADIRKKFLSLRGLQERQVYLLTIMTEYPLQVADSGLIAWFDDEKDYLKTSRKIEWLDRLADYSLTSSRAFYGLHEAKQGLILMVLAEERSIEKAARTLKQSRKHCHNLFWQAIESIFPDYKNVHPRPTTRKLREQLAVLMDLVTSSRERSGNSEGYLENLAAGRENVTRGYDSSDEENYGQSDEVRE